MAEGLHSLETRKDLDALREQVTVNAAKSDKMFEDIRNLIAAIATNQPPGDSASSMEQEGTSPMARGLGTQSPGYQLPTNRSKVEFPHFNGKALQWHQIFMRTRLARTSPDWGEYVNALQDRFGAMLFEDPMSELMNLRQTGRRLSPQDLDEKRAKGLCFLCDEKYTRDHVCARKRHLFLMEFTDENETELDVIDQEETSWDISDKPEDSPSQNQFHISMNGINGIHDFRTMKVHGSTKGKTIHILIDTGSTHNFLDMEVAKKLGCPIIATEPFPVSIANGNKLYSKAA
ncbi:hypothetical protein BUALT_Bualt15G0134000 [Buddleja alternifolia]|uniref:Retrotransposon gag protein n=1 Tax=Buddleja alternifolia TaxID=168488 RepID=A0AAV6WQL7_9LAMI|nr:hypothetical protein BUALT_Bualt15G0134000 [Buddleja alternifolia]